MEGTPNDTETMRVTYLGYMTLRTEYHLLFDGLYNVILMDNGRLISTVTGRRRRKQQQQHL